jgi:L-asparagine transporter-like permease
MAFILKALGGIAALILLVITLLGSIVTLGGFLLTAIKVLIVVIFLAVVTMIVFSILRDRSRRRNEATDI